MFRQTKWLPLCLLFLLIIAITPIGYAQEDETPPPQFGVSLSPRSFSDDDFTTFFLEATETGQIVSSVGNFTDLADTQTGPYVVTDLAGAFDYVPLVQVHWGPNEEPVIPSAEEQQTYIENAVAFAETYQPLYFGIGVEVNRLWMASPAAFEAFVTFFDEAYTAIKVVAPDTQVFTTFQLENMKGFNGGLFGGENNLANAQWDLIERFPNSDLIGFTTYPGLIYETPDEILGDYYSSLTELIDRPIVITELGWYVDDSIEGWESDEDEQAAFVDRFFTLIEDVPLEFVIWSFLYDQAEAPQPFDRMGLRDMDGTPRPAWDVWEENVNLLSN